MSESRGRVTHLELVPLGQGVHRVVHKLAHLPSLVRLEQHHKVEEGERLQDSHYTQGKYRSLGV